MALGVAVLGLWGFQGSATEFNHTTNLIDEMGPAPEMPQEESDQPQFTKVIDDLPLMPGLQLQDQDDVLFTTKLDGRIAETEAVGSVDIDDVYKFYHRTLPQLGWSVINGRSYRRENDVLRIEAKADGKMTHVHFSVKPSDK